MPTLNLCFELECDGMKNVVQSKTMIRKHVFLLSFSRTVQEKQTQTKAAWLVKGDITHSFWQFHINLEYLYSSIALFIALKGL